MRPDRYHRHRILKEFGPLAQRKLADGKVLVVGVGGLGVPVLTYLNAMGVGTLGLVDDDRISLSNLHRQVMFKEGDIGDKKIAVAVRELAAQNSDTRLVAHETFLTRDNALELIEGYDLVVDASDNFPTRYLVNDACVLLQKPFVYGALHGFEGQVSVLNFRNGPTYRCLFPDMPKTGEVPDCNAHGVLGVVPGIIGNLQALETVKVLTGVGKPLSGTLLVYDGLVNEFRKIAFSPRPGQRTMRALQATYGTSCEASEPTIGAGALYGLWKKGTVQLLDVRTREEYDAFHLPGAVHCPLTALEDHRPDLAINGTAYVICRSGLRSRKAIGRLQRHFPDTVFVNVTGGMNELPSHATEP